MTTRKGRVTPPPVSLGTTWHVGQVASVTDGDTFRVVRWRNLDLDGRFYVLSDADTEEGVPIRLTWVDTPERGNKPGWTKARADLDEWISVREHAGIALSVICYASGGWDRIMGDLRDANGESASQWLMKERGWPPFESS